MTTQIATRVSTDGRIGNGIRLDRTSGRIEIWQSPFTAPQQIAVRLNCTRGGDWRIETNRVGGQGDVTQAVNGDTSEAINLWRDARGRWWIQREIKRGTWLPDIDATEALCTLLDMARSARKERWTSGEVHWLVSKKAFMKEGDGVVYLHVIGRTTPLAVFALSPLAGTWPEVSGLDKRYSEWVERVK